MRLSIKRNRRCGARKKFKELELERVLRDCSNCVWRPLSWTDKIYNSLDTIDLRAIHLFHQDEEGRVDAYARIFETGATIHFGRG